MILHRLFQTAAQDVLSYRQRRCKRFFHFLFAITCGLQSIGINIAQISQHTHPATSWPPGTSAPTSVKLVLLLTTLSGPAKMLILKLKLKLKTVVNAACEIVKLRAAVGHDLAYLGENDTHILKIAVSG